MRQLRKNFDRKLNLKKCDKPKNAKISKIVPKSIFLSYYVHCVHFIGKLIQFLCLNGKLYFIFIITIFCISANLNVYFYKLRNFVKCVF